MSHAHTTSDLAALSIGSLVWVASAQPLLDDATEDELVAKGRRGDRRALEQLAMSNVRIVIDEAIRLRGLGTPQERLVRVGIQALLEALRHYDPTAHGRVSDHLRTRVRSAVHAAIGVS